MAPNAKIAMRVDDWKILADAELTTFELYNLGSDPREETDLSSSEPAQLEKLRTQLVAHNAAIDAEGPDWWRRLGPSGGKPIEDNPKKKTPRKAKK